MKYSIYIILVFLFIPLILWSQDTAKTTTGSAGQSFNPDISVIGDFLGRYSNKTDDELTLREVELAFNSYVDPYCRADVFLGICNEDSEFKLEVEEGYFTFLALPYNLQARIGIFKPAFGEVNTQHGHILPWVEYPLMIQNYLGDEGWSATGISLNWLTPIEHYLEVTYQEINSGATPLVGDATGNLTHLLHVKNYWDISDESNIQLGLSGMWLPLEAGSNHATAQSLDFTYRWRPAKSGKYHSLKWQTELFAAQKEEITNTTEKTEGLFSALEYQMDTRWFIGTLFDYSELPDDKTAETREYSAYLTFKQTEFAYWRLGYAYTKSDIADINNERQVFLQLNIGVGAHPAHKY